MDVWIVGREEGREGRGNGRRGGNEGRKEEGGEEMGGWTYRWMGGWIVERRVRRNFVHHRTCSSSLGFHFEMEQNGLQGVIRVTHNLKKNRGPQARRA